MAEEPENNPPPPEPPILSALDATEETDAPAPLALAPKRQRRPSVRLGKIGDQRASAHDHDSHTRHPSMLPWSWWTPKESSRTLKARSVRRFTNQRERRENCYRIFKFTPLKIEFEILFFQLTKISFKILKFWIPFSKISKQLLLINKKRI